VDIFYREVAVESYLTASLETIFDIHKTMIAGDILVFLTGAEEIDEMVELIQEKATRYIQPNIVNKILHCLTPKRQFEELRTQTRLPQESSSFAPLFRPSWKPTNEGKQNSVIYLK